MTRAHPIALDRTFHTTIAGIIENAALNRFVGELFDQEDDARFREAWRSHFESPASWREAFEEHRAIRDVYRIRRSGACQIGDAAPSAAIAIEIFQELR